MSKITDFSFLSAPATNDLLPLVDVSDPSQSSSGTTKQTSVSQLFTLLQPVTQSFSLAVNNSYQTQWMVTVTGQTDDPLAPFGSVFGSRTYGTSPAIQGPALWMGYNPALYSRQVSSSDHGASGISFFADAGDTNNGAGGHGIEGNFGFVTADGNHATDAFQFVGVDDNTNTVTTTIRCGIGPSSAIVFQNGDASSTFCIISNNSQTVQFSVPISSVITTAGTNNFVLSAQGTNGQSVITLQGNNGASTNAQVLFSKLGSSTAWSLIYTGTSFLIQDTANASRTALGFVAGTVSTAYVYTNSMHKVFGSLVVGNTALATNATSGFLYLPSCAGAPTGVPSAQTGTAAAVFDTTNNKIWVYNGSWKGVTVA